MNRMTAANNERYEMNKVLSAVKAAGSVLLFCHVAPDGDTLGSALALRLRLMAMGKQVTVLLDGDVPSNLAFLPGAQSIVRPQGETQSAELGLAVDVSCHDRLGACEPFFAKAAHTAQVDHHRTNEAYAEHNAIDGAAPATAVLVYRMFAALGGPITRDEAICLYTALSTDTGNFVYESTNAECFEMMSALMRAGLPLAEYSRRLFRCKELAVVKLLGLALPSLRVAGDGKVAGLCLTLEQMQAAGATSGHTDGVVDYAIDLEGVEAAYFARETEEGRVKVSLRSLEPVHVDAVAARFGGGGHRLASGLTVDMPLDEAAQTIEKALVEACGGAQA